MLQILIDAVFSILNFVASIFLGPIFKGISVLIPSISDFIVSIGTFLGYGLQYVDFFVNLLMIPLPILTIFIGFYVGIFAFNLTIRVFGLGMAIYNYFKP